MSSRRNASSKPKLKGGAPTPLSEGTLYFYTDGSYANNGQGFGSWSVVGVKRENNEETTFYETAANDVPVRCSGQMELRALINAFQTAITNYTCHNICIRTDHESLSKVINKYLDTYSLTFHTHDTEDGAVAIRQRIRNAYNNKSHGMPDDYGQLFNLLDSVGKQAWHHHEERNPNARPPTKFTIEWIRRNSDQWIARADHVARSHNGAQR